MDQPDATARLTARVTGRVQGVAFRWSARDTAQRLGLTGWVRNRVDGSVELVAEGNRPQLEQLLDWCHRGPSMASVEEVDARWEPSRNEFSAFSIRH